MTATRAGCGGTGASTESSEASVTTHYKGILVSNQHLQEEVSIGQGNPHCFAV